MQNYNGKVKKIYTKRIALELRLRGFNIIGTEPNYKKPQYDVYLFKDTEELNKTLSELTKKKDKDTDSNKKDINTTTATGRRKYKRRVTDNRIDE